MGSLRFLQRGAGRNGTSLLWIRIIGNANIRSHPFATIQTKKLQTFAIRFNTSDIANEFKAAFLKGQEEMRGLLAGKDAGDSAESKEVDDAASVLESLSVGKAEGTSDDAAPASTDA